MTPCRQTCDGTWFPIALLVAVAVGVLALGSSLTSVSDRYSYDGESTAYTPAGPESPASVDDLVIHRSAESSGGLDHVYDAPGDAARPNARLADAGSAPQSILKLPTSQTWGRMDTLDHHFLRHGADFGARSADDYASQASQFFQRAQQQGLPTKIDANGVIRVYDPATNTFGAYNPNGTTATFFTPKTGADYWAKQPGVSPWSP